MARARRASCAAVLKLRALVDWTCGVCDHTLARSLTHTWIRKWTFPAGGGELFLELHNECFQLLDLLLRSVGTIAGTRSDNHKQKVQQRRATGKYGKCCHLQSWEKVFRASTRGHMQEVDVRAPRSPQSLQRHCLLHNPSWNKATLTTTPTTHVLTR